MDGYAHGWITPSRSDLLGSGMMSSGSTSIRVPKPEHVGHAPNGELNENDRGSSSSNDRPSARHARCSLKVSSRSLSSSAKSTRSSVTVPPASRNAVSTESVRRRFASGFAASRSITTSIVCFSCFFNFGGSARLWTTPSIRAREKPWVCSDRKRSTYSPLRARTSGARIWNRVPSSSSST